MGSLSVCLLAFLCYNFHKNRPIILKFEYVLKLRKFTLYNKNSHCIVHTFFTGTRQKFEHVIIYCFFKTSRIVMKFWYVFMVGNITSYAKNNHCFIHKFYRDTSKVWIHYLFLFHQIKRITLKTGIYFFKMKPTSENHYMQYNNIL